MLLQKGHSQLRINQVKRPKHIFAEQANKFTHDVHRMIIFKIIILIIKTIFNFSVTDDSDYK